MKGVYFKILADCWMLTTGRLSRAAGGLRVSRQ